MVEATAKAQHGILALSVFLPARLQEAVASVSVREAVASVKQGSWMTKWRRQPLFGLSRRRVYVRVDMEALRVVWSGGGMGAVRSKCLYLKSVDAILPGLAGKKSWKKMSTTEKELGFEMQSRRRVDHFICESVADWRLWMRGLVYAHHKSRVKRASLIESAEKQHLLRALWRRADVDNSESIQFHECVPLLKSLDYHGDIHYVSYVFYHSIEDASHVLEYDEFEMAMLTLLTHEAAKEEFLRFCAGGQDTPLMTTAEFSRFLDSIQLALPDEVKATLDQIHSFSQPYSTLGITSLPKTLQDRLTLFGFCRYLISDRNHVFVPAKLEQYQLMSHPITYYWIRTASHWILPDDTPQKTMVRLVELLHEGVRAVVLSCHRSEENGQLVMNGGWSSGPSALLLRDVLKTITHHAFSKGNQCPVILLLDLQNCKESVAEDADALLRQVLGAQLRTPPPNWVMTPGTSGNPVPWSPSALYNSFLALRVELPAVAHPLMQIATLPLTALMRLEWNENLLFASSSAATAALSAEELVLEKHICRPGRPQLDATRNALSASWAVARPIKLTAAARDGETLSNGPTVWTAKDLREIGKYPHTLQALCKAEQARLPPLTVVLPEGSNMICSNVDPVSAWRYGFQMVVLPYGTFGLAHLLDAARFQENGNCGYVLKPTPVVRQSTPLDKRALSPWTEAPVGFSIAILAAQQLPRPGTERRHILGVEDTLSPYIIVSIHGVPGDCSVQKTGLVSGNGLNPTWRRATFTFTVTVPSVGFLVFEVRSFHPTRTVTVASAAIPVSCLRPGLRWVPLRNVVLQPVPWSGILVRIRLRSVHTAIQDNAFPTQPNF